ncbi:signal recognition particle subunit FFH/SRP54 (srp54) [Carboxydocella sporoproducens DSM 16521]|uniref:Signal recognition particle protein n=2 Tax=Carboxydocella TaxID=178898 RepID=A0A1T4PYW8_9FIRM|nr:MULTISPECIES: signal recognition particle protein [Carboxydocella]AVX20482.1 signal recognition particle subunit FFH/SRP54 (srp54) [Carboxydocella thermautotrophica]AVX30903.1 signal recognition particle subunit FFH/SRP54 (srp54) [Carboxydocella thermautotrophica]SJZ96158.1 signal recognition particle subunit FFH/SRP54 (srp54) [Carboxydocella sporoproducens DSM 16521]
MAIFENLSERLQAAFKRLRGKGKVTEEDVSEVMREIRVALLEADVSYKVVKDFIKKVKERAVGQEVLASLTPAQQVIKIVHEELIELLGGIQSRLTTAPKPPTVIMLVGLQGAGKTTSAGKLANLLRKQGKKPLLVAADIYRPAAVKQLQVLGEQLQIPVFAMGTSVSAVNIAKGALEYAASHGRDMVIIDTAGRLHINEELMQELQDIKAAIKPHEILLVVDAMTGQTAVEVAETFNAQLGIDGVIMTKLDGDAKGGAALSVRAVTGKPIKFAGMGEKLDALEPFYPDRLASRILGMGDVLSLIEKAQAAFDQAEAEKLQEKMRKAEFTLEDFLNQMQQMKKLGPLENILSMLPGIGGKELKELQKQINPKEMARVEAIILSMTPQERAKPEIIDSSRKKRIARGSGTRVQDVNKLLEQFKQAKAMMKQFAQLEKKMKKKGGIKLPFFK